MPKTNIALSGLLGGAICLLAAPALAQDTPAAPPPPPADGGHFHRPFFQRPGFAELDTNHDGKLDKAELSAPMQKMADKMADKMFDRLDANHDGSISEAEFNAARPPNGPKDGMGGWRHRMKHHGGWRHEGPPPMGMGHGMGPMDLKALDKDGDGKISFAEFSAPMEARLKARFDRLDANHDGVLEADELPQPPAWGPKGAPAGPPENGTPPAQK